MAGGRGARGEVARGGIVSAILRGSALPDNSRWIHDESVQSRWTAADHSVVPYSYRVTPRHPSTKRLLQRAAAR